MPDETPGEAQVEDIEVDPRHARPFGDWLREQRDGMCHQQVSEGLWDVVDAVLATAKPGKLTLEINIKPASRGNHEMVIVTDNVTVKIPEPEKEAAFFFVNDTGNLQRDNPRQPQLPLRTVSEPGQATAPATTTGESV